MGGSSGIDARVIGDRYSLIERVGRGGMGTVWSAHDSVLSRTVAVKEVDLPLVHEDERAALRERTMREARTAAQLSHPNAVTVYDVVEEDGKPWIIMQLVAADSLADVIRDTGPLPPGRVAEIGLAVLDALQAAHAAGILHRDVKPGNVLIGHDGRVVLTDFGIATLEGDSSLTSTGMLLGAPAYIAPERARGLRPGPASDLWSLGATLYTAVEGRPPYERDTPLATVTASMTEGPPPVVLAGPLADILRGLLEPDPDYRLAAARARDLLQQVASERPVVEEPPGPPDPPTEEIPVPGAVEAANRTQVIPRPDPPSAPPPVHQWEPAGRPAPVPPVRPARRRPDARRLLLAFLLVVAVAAAVALVLLLRAVDRQNQQVNPPKATTKAAVPGSSAAKPTPSAGSSSGASSSSGGGSSAAGVPVGFKRYTDPSGFSVAVPQNWQQTAPTGSANDGQLNFVDPTNSARFLRFGYTTHPKDDAAADWRQQEKKLQKREPSYRRISITPVNYRGWPTAADWEFRLGSTHVRNRGFKVDDSHGYAIYLSAPESMWSDSLHYFDVAASTFQPAH